MHLAKKRLNIPECDQNAESDGVCLCFCCESWQLYLITYLVAKCLFTCSEVLNAAEGYCQSTLWSISVFLSDDCVHVTPFLQTVTLTTVY